MIEATNEHQRSERDLSAQQTMAKWALLMLLATVAMAGITAFGVYYVWRTLVATRKMASETRAIGQKQVRAYLSPSRAEIIDFDSTKLLLRIEIRSAGASPAISLCRNQAKNRHHWRLGGAFRSDLGSHTMGLEADIGPRETKFFDAYIHLEIINGCNDQSYIGDRYLGVEGEVTYRDVFQNPYTVVFRYEVPSGQLITSGEIKRVGHHGRTQQTE